MSSGGKRPNWLCRRVLFDSSASFATMLIETLIETGEPLGRKAPA
jgi:hypothetical protein